eukprot:CFRG1003T1
MPPYVTTDFEVANKVNRVDETTSFTREQILTPTNDKYCILEDGVYDLQAFKSKHPGGDVLDYFCGQDATPHFYMMHQHEYLPSVLAQYRVGSVPQDTSYVYHTPLMKQIKSAVRRVLPVQHWWAPPSWYVKATFIISCTFYCDYVWISSGPTVLLAVVTGLLYALIGLNIQHDANHGAVSRTPIVNRLFGYTQDYIGGSSMLWIRQHVVGHHTHCNRHQFDPDTKGGHVITLSRYSLPKEFHYIQQYYFLPLIHMLGFQWIFSGMYDLVYLQYKGEKLPQSYRNERKIAIAFRIFFYVRRFIIPFALYPSWHTLFCTYLYIGIGALYLGFFFILSHIFVGTKSLPKDAHHVDWARHQIESSSVVCGTKLAISNGGLNYQIEHHLFPRMAHAHYSLIQPIVKKVCEENHVTYKQFGSIIENLESTFCQLKALGSIAVYNEFMEGL